MVSNVGFCDEKGEKIIINKHESNGSLDQYLSDPTLTWMRRIKICAGIARAISFIHYDERRNSSFIHRNIKSSKILLDENWEAKLSGFELSKTQTAARRHHLLLAQLSGTIGYVDPIYEKTGGVTHKSDVYSLGVVLFEVLCGRKAFVVDKPSSNEGLSTQSTKRPSPSQAVKPDVKRIKLDYIPKFLYPVDLSSFDLSVQTPSFTIEPLQLFPTAQPQLFYQELFKDNYKETKLDDINYKDPSFVIMDPRLFTRKSLIDDITNEGSLLAPLAKSHYEKGTLDDMIDPCLRKQMDSQSLKIFSEAAYFCLREARPQRPYIDRVIFALEEALRHQLTYENFEHSIVGVERTSPDYLKGKDLEHLKIGLDAIKLATENFSATYCIGSGGYGDVYKAELEHFDSTAIKGRKESELPKIRSTVSIKCIKNRDDTQGEHGFFAEVETLSSCKHPNIIPLLGFCHEHPHMILIYEHASNGSLDDYLGNEGKMINFTLVQCLKICINIARGLDYIHTSMEDKQKIIHRDIKSANILLGKNWEVKIADFGLSKFHPMNLTTSTLNTRNVVGTKVYWDPEYENTGKLKKESDIYSFGVVLFELMSGRLAYDPVYTNHNEYGIAPIVRQHYEKGTLKELIDPKLKDEIDENIFTLRKGPNQESLDTFARIAYECVAVKQVQRPTIKVVIKELTKALFLQETHKDSLRLSFDDIKLHSLIGTSRFSRVFRGFVYSKRSTTCVVKRWFSDGFPEEQFLKELELLSEYKHKNIIGLLGYCDKQNKKIIVYEYASNLSLDRHLDDASLTWTKRLKIGIDIAVGLDFLHGGVVTQDTVIHRDIRSSHILLTSDWKAKISGFGLSLITPINKEIDFVFDSTWDKLRHEQPYNNSDFLTRESDIYSLGLVLFEMMCGEAMIGKGPRPSFKHRYEEGRLDEIVFKGIKEFIMPKSLTIFQTIAYQCLIDKRQDRPTANEVVIQLKKALEFQWFSLCTNGKRNEMISAKMFSYGNQGLLKWKSMHKSRFQKVAKMMDTSNLNIQIQIKTQFLSSNVMYGVHLVFKFCESKTFSSKPMYVNLRYRLRSETLNTYFATLGDDKWISVELYRFLNYKEDTEFEAVLESFSTYCCRSHAIFIEGVEFRAIDNVEKKKRVLESNQNMDYIQLFLNDYTEIFKRSKHIVHDRSKKRPFSILCKGILIDEGEKWFSLSKATGKKCYMLPAKEVLHDSSNMKLFTWTHSAHGRFQEVIELLSRQVFRIKCKIEIQLLSSNTKYVCYLVFKLSKKCCGIHCPVKVRDLLTGKNREMVILYFRSPSPLNFHDVIRVPEQREDGWMEVNVWEFNVTNELKNSHVPMDLKFISYEGTMCGLVIHGLEFRPM